jgi:ankyrin repeat protein
MTGNTPLHIACQNVKDLSDIQVFQAMLKRLDQFHLLAPTKHIGDFLAMQNHEGKTPLHILCEQKDLVTDQDTRIQQCVEIICTHLRQEDMTIKDKNGNTPLELAEKCGNAGMAMQLKNFLN